VSAFSPWWQPRRHNARIVGFGSRAAAVILTWASDLSGAGGAQEMIHKSLKRQRIFSKT